MSNVPKLVYLALLLTTLGKLQNDCVLIFSFATRFIKIIHVTMSHEKIYVGNTENNKHFM